MNNFLVVVLAFAATAYAGPLEERVVGGSDAGDGEFTYMVSVQRNNWHHCGGALINEYWVVSAAHCYYKVTDVISVMVGMLKLTVEGTRYPVDKIILHENYDPYNVKLDIALLKVTKPVVMTEKVQPIPLQMTPVPDGSMLDLTGWGRLSFPNGKNPDVLQKIKLRAISTEYCNTFGMSADETKICTLTRKGEGTCMGDSGGPLVYDGHLAGIVSYGIACAVGDPDVFTKVSAYIDWIDNTMRNNS